jgi:hypothetical protein
VHPAPLLLMPADEALNYPPRGAQPHNPVNCVNLYSINERPEQYPSQQPSGQMKNFMALAIWPRVAEYESNPTPPELIRTEHQKRNINHTHCEWLAPKAKQTPKPKTSW